MHLGSLESVQGGSQWGSPSTVKWPNNQPSKTEYSNRQPSNERAKIGIQISFLIFFFKLILKIDFKLF